MRIPAFALLRKSPPVRCTQITLVLAYKSPLPDSKKSVRHSQQVSVYRFLVSELLLDTVINVNMAVATTLTILIQNTILETHLLRSRMIRRQPFPQPVPVDRTRLQKACSFRALRRTLILGSTFSTCPPWSRLMLNYSIVTQPFLY